MDASTRQQTGRRAARTPGDLLLEPVPLVALAVLVLNDHWLKTLAPGAVTGKLSDLAGLVVFPLLLVALIEGARFLLGFRPWALGPGSLAAAIAVTALAFTSVKSSAEVARLYSTALGALQWPVRAGLALVEGRALPHGLGTFTVRADPTDLVALMALSLAWIAGCRVFRAANLACAPLGTA